ncbi:MAG: hypothetical protein V1489_00960 [Candidatus Liptonbacteria bacterium]
MLTKDQISDYERRLEKEKKELLEEIDKDSRPENFGDDSGDFDEDEEADEAEEFGNKLSIAKNFKDRVNEIDEALNKIKKGEYGVCELCHKEIGSDLLDVITESRLCESCKKKE